MDSGFNMLGDFQESQESMATPPSSSESVTKNPPLSCGTPTHTYGPKSDSEKGFESARVVNINYKVLFEPDDGKPPNTLWDREDFDMMYWKFLEENVDKLMGKPVTTFGEEF